MFNKDNETELLRASIKGDTVAFESIIRKYQSLICDITFSATGNVETSEELAHETFISAWNGLEQLKDLRKFRSWLSTIARNVIKNSFRRQKRDILSKAAPIEAVEGSCCTKTEPDETAMTEQRQAMVAQALEQIPDKYRESLVLFYRQGQSVSDVAEQLELSEGAVRQRLSRGRVMLKKQVAAMVESTISRTGPGKAFSVAVIGSISAAAMKGAAASAAVVAASASGAGIGAAITVVMGTVTAKIVTAAAVIAIGIGSVAAYKTVKDSPAGENSQVHASTVIEQEAISNTEPVLTEIESSEEETLTIQQQESIENDATIASEEDVAENTTEKSTNDTKQLETAKGAGEKIEIVDRDNTQKDRLGLKVITKETGEAIENAQISVRIYGEADKSSEGKTDQFGRIDILLGEEKLTSLSIAVKVDGRVPTKISYRGEGENISVPLNYTLALEKGTSIGGIINNEQGQPVQGTSVSLLVPSQTGQTDYPSIWDHVVKTDDQGKWRCDIMPSELEDVWIRLAHPDYINDTSYGATEKPTMDKLRDFTGIMVMKKGLEVHGIVMDMEGNPIANAFVAQGSDRWGSHYPSTRTDEKGKFSFVNAESGQMILTVSAKSMAPDIKPIEVRAGLGDVEFYLEAGYTIRGRIVDVDGNAVSGAFVTADTWRGHRSIKWRVSSDSQGRFQWNEAPADEVLFDMGKQKFMSIREAEMTASDEEYELVMYRPVKVSGSVVDAQSGEPVKSFKLISGIDWGNNNPVYWSDRDTKTFADGKYSKVFAEPRYGYAIKIEANGYLPSVSDVFGADKEEIVIDFALKKGDGITGIVYLPDGTPAKDADVVLSTRGISIQDGDIVQKTEKPFCKTNPDGRFSFKPQVEEFIIVAVHEKGWGRIHRDELNDGVGLTLEPWAHIEGMVYVGAKAGSGERVSINRAYTDEKFRVSFHDNVVADEKGRFEFGRVMAGKLQLSRQIKISHNSYSNTDIEHIEIAPGEKIEVQIGGKGRSVAGKLVVPAGSEGWIDWKVGRVGISTIWDIEPPRKKYPEGFAALSRKEQGEWTSQWYKSEEMTEYRAQVEEVNKERRHYPVIMHEDGTFNADGVQAGHYEFMGYFSEPTNDEFGDGKAVGKIEFEFDVFEMDGGFSDEVLDLGVIKAEVFIDVEIGSLAPNFEVIDVDGNTFRLSDYRGRFVLIEQWHRQAREDATPGIEEMGRLYERFGDDDRFVMLSVTDGQSMPPELMKQYVEHYGMKWAVGLFEDGQSMGKALRGYGMEEFPGRFLVGPDGELLGRNLKGQELIDAIEEALSQ